ncbi:polysaccharide deacetylase family protein [Roseiarcaceae bacterium H3SJ34-1]|uniref:polysaccharide deacetylase family protein n=1 Tax=Terripilifer ovatus TaxID=3032367 RepID=UPI003AB99BE9|nr:polysaccharide deacetylase family protein [Roseiarcaceae bacterium H3SJ34-1]
MDKPTGPIAHDRFDFSPIVDRPPLRWPNGARVALWVIPNIEHFMFDRPSTSITPLTTGFVPDVLNYSWRDFGVRVGIWRMMDVMQRYGVRGTVALNADVCDNYPRIIEAGNKLGWEWMGHGKNNSMLMANRAEDEERQMIREIHAQITRATGKKPRGWLGPALTESHNTLDLLAEVGFDYVGDWVNDEQPYPMRVKSGQMTSIPYSIEINDIPAFLDGKQSPQSFGQMIKDQFDVLYEDSAESGRVMSICLHPFLIGHPFRIKYFDDALKHITSRKDVWLATGSEIVDAYRAQSR